MLGVTDNVSASVVMQGAYERLYGGQGLSFNMVSGEVERTIEGSAFVYFHMGALGITVYVQRHEVIATSEEWLAFKSLVSAWRRERGVTSSTTEAALCPAYQSIIGMGARAVPLIFAQLEDEGSDPDQWFWALKAILRVDPVREEDRGNYARMAKAWLAWWSLRRRDAW